ncbi:MAG TPA: hypothetical protein VME20_06175 [Acidimicrobiales bacterium]|nr:hypothetical protein [Acidimicrobiales bacterium]
MYQRSEYVLPGVVLTVWETVPAMLVALPKKRDHAQPGEGAQYVPITWAPPCPPTVQSEIAVEPGGTLA